MNSGPKYDEKCDAASTASLSADLVLDVNSANGNSMRAPGLEPGRGYPPAPKADLRRAADAEPATTYKEGEVGAGTAPQSTTKSATNGPNFSPSSRNAAIVQAYRRICEAVDRLEYKGWQFCLTGPLGPEWGVVLFARFRDATDAPWSTRRYPISMHATASEVVQTALKCVLVAEEHEAREAFQYRGRAIFGPHYDVEALVGLCDAGAFDVRPAPPTAGAA